MSDHEREELEALITAPGWLRVVNRAKQEWQDQIARHMETAANDTDDVVALQKLRQVLAAKKAVERLLLWPEERISQLKAASARLAQPASLSRRGSL